MYNATVAPALRTGEEMELYGDGRYLGADKREGAITRNTNGKTICYKSNRRSSQSKNSTLRSRGQIRRREREQSSIRAEVEPVFGLVKDLFHFRKTRYKGRRK